MKYVKGGDMNNSNRIKRKNLAGGGEARFSQNTKTQCSISDHSTEQQIKQQHIIQPGTALAASLESYKSRLLLAPHDRHISSLVDCCDFILNEVERGQS